MGSVFFFLMCIIRRKLQPESLLMMTSTNRCVYSEIQKKKLNYLWNTLVECFFQFSFHSFLFLSIFVYIIYQSLIKTC